MSKRIENHLVIDLTEVPEKVTVLGQLQDMSHDYNSKKGTLTIYGLPKEVPDSKSHPKPPKE